MLFSVIASVVTAATATAVQSFISGVSASVAVYTVCKKSAGKTDK